jgi:hypothetical protein
MLKWFTCYVAGIVNFLINLYGSDGIVVKISLVTGNPDSILVSNIQLSFIPDKMLCWKLDIRNVKRIP